MLIALQLVSLLWAATCVACLFLFIEWRAAQWEARKLRQMHEGACERIAAASAVIARNAERSPLARLEAWIAAGHRLRKPFIDFEPFGWVIELHATGNAPVLVYGWPGDGDEPNERHLHDGADLGECLTAALDLWGQVRGARCADGE